jgi:hypothetical protein
MANIEEPVWRCKKRIGNLMARLNQHAAGEIELTTTQVAAIRLYLDKTLPSLAATTISGNPEAPLYDVASIVKALDGRSSGLPEIKG